MMSKGLFVTGTDTGVGKTVVTASIVALLRSARIDAVPLKPVQTGAERRGDRWVAPDLDACLRLAGLHVESAEYRSMAPACFALPASPHLAAAQAGERIAISRILEAFRDLAARHDAVIAEGAGGVLVPLDEKLLMVDLMKALGVPVLLVARPSLGTINHTLLSVRELVRTGCAIAGIVLCDTRPAVRGIIEADNRRTIERLSGVPVLGDLPFIPEIAEPSLSPDAFVRLVGAHFPPPAEIMERLRVP
jgi:dethiobiotin synthetase